jgi:hypothetical protein
MTVARPSAYHAGLRDAAVLAEQAAAGIRSRPDAGSIRQKAAVEALEAFADELRRLVVPETGNAVLAALTTIAAISGAEGEIVCPECAGRLRWTRDEGNGHVWDRCETDDCLAWVT